MMNSLSEVRRVRERMSQTAGHDVRKLIAIINERRAGVESRIVDPGAKAEQCDSQRITDHAVSGNEPSATAK